MVRKKTGIPLPHVRVSNPITHHTWDDGRYTSYDICIQTSHKSFSLKKSTVKRRFSEFAWLRTQLKAHHSTRTPPQLPPKKFFDQRFDKEFIEKRRDGLENFINRVVGEALYLSDTVLHLFLQSDLSTKEMDNFVDGKLSDDFIDKLWLSDGKKKNDRPQDLRRSPDRLSLGDDTREDSGLGDGLSGSMQSTESSMTCDSRTPDFSSAGSSLSEENVHNKGDNCELNGLVTPLGASSNGCRASPCFSINGNDDISD